MTPEECEQAEYDELDKNGVLKFAELPPVRVEAVVLHLCPNCQAIMREQKKFRGLWTCDKCDGMELTDEGANAFALELMRVWIEKNMPSLVEKFYKQNTQIERLARSDNTLRSDVGFSE